MTHTRYMLDTNMVSQVVRSNPKVLGRLTALPLEAICISSVTEGEVLYGLAKRPVSPKLAKLIDEFLQRVEICAWDSEAARVYGTLRADLERAGTSLAPLDTMIAAHAKCVDASLVTNDAAFRHVKQLEVVDWTQ
jgi:tRNA(fMet)-specific endonuclease VapC